ncbi:MAG: glycosyltransferase [Chloroflexi bacterium]|nr:glycosyltransferase [Chloroflexota bacterium]
MKVCVVTTVFPRWLGDGEGAFIWQFVRALAQSGIDLRVVAMHSPGTATHEYFENIEIVRPPYWWPQQAEMLRKDGGGLPINWRKYRLARVQTLPFAFIHTLTASHFARGCDLIHAHFTLSAAAACVGRQRHRCPVIATVQGSDIYQVPQYPGGAWFTRTTLNACNRVTALSRSLQDTTVALGVPRDKIEVIPNSIDTSQFTPPTAKAREKIILFTGWLIKRKGVEYLLRALPAVLQACPDYRLVVIGEGPEEANLKALATNVAIHEQVTFAGFLPQEGVRAWLQRAKLFVLPSLEEGLGVVVLEALACGTPVVASNVGGIVDMVTETVGALVPATDVSALASAMIQILANDQEWARMSMRAREHAVANFSGPQIAKQYIDLYDSVLTS